MEANALPAALESILLSAQWSLTLFLTSILNAETAVAERASSSWYHWVASICPISRVSARSCAEIAVAYSDDGLAVAIFGTFGILIGPVYTDFAKGHMIHG